MESPNYHIEKIIKKKISDLDFIEPIKSNSKKFKTRNSYAILGEYIIVKLNDKYYSIISKKDGHYLEDYKFYHMSQGPVIADGEKKYNYMMACMEENGKKKYITFHKLIGAKKHINKNTLDNRRNNLFIPNRFEYPDIPDTDKKPKGIFPIKKNGEVYSIMSKLNYKGKVYSTKFAVKKYGLNLAKSLAYKWRADKLRELRIMNDEDESGNELSDSEKNRDIMNKIDEIRKNSKINKNEEDSDTN